jgi:hypothetical protein
VTTRLASKQAFNGVARRWTDGGETRTGTEVPGPKQMALLSRPSATGRPLAVLDS